VLQKIRGFDRDTHDQLNVVGRDLRSQCRMSGKHGGNAFVGLLGDRAKLQRPDLPEKPGYD
jgi:hypothetical protein